LRVFRLKDSVYNVYIANQFQTTFAQGEGGGEKNPFVEVTLSSKEENSEDFCPRIRPLFKYLLNGRKQQQKDTPRAVQVIFLPLLIQMCHESIKILIFYFRLE
jgi:hypothetical protein